MPKKIPIMYQPEVVLNEIELKILNLLSKGIKNKNLGTYLHLSNSAVEKRKKKLKEKLKFVGNDEDLLELSRKNKWI